MESGMKRREARGLEWARKQEKGRIREIRSELNRLFSGGEGICEETLLEIGCGHGHWLGSYAEAHPGTFCAGIDLKTRRVRKAWEKAKKRELKNIYFRKAEATEFLRAMPKGRSWDKVCLLFPDPWPKARHHKNRLIREDFLDLLWERVGEGGKLYFRTDHEGYFEWAQSVLDVHKKWHIEPDASWIHEHRTYFQELMKDWQSLVAVRLPGLQVEQGDNKKLTRQDEREQGIDTGNEITRCN